MLSPLEDIHVRPEKTFCLTAALACSSVLASHAANLTPSASPAGEAVDGVTTAKTASHKAGNKFGGLADYYHHSLYGKKTASGQVLQKDLLTAAHRTLPFGTRVHVVNKRTGKSCVVVINDRGPYTKSKVIDVSHAAATKLGLIQAGTGDVACTVLKADEDFPGHKANQDPAETEED
jgi:rare lipoprotein A